VLAEPRLRDCVAALQRPQPRVALGLALRGIATAAIDVSDGLLADLGHILEQSRVAARLQFAVPASADSRTGLPGWPAATTTNWCLPRRRQAKRNRRPWRPAQLALTRINH
jgi:thiamine monophosphate kinase